VQHEAQRDPGVVARDDLFQGLVAALDELFPDSPLLEGVERGDGDRQGLLLRLGLGGESGEGQRSESRGGGGGEALKEFEILI